MPYVSSYNRYCIQDSSPGFLNCIIVLLLNSRHSPRVRVSRAGRRCRKYFVLRSNFVNIYYKGLIE